MSILIRFKIKSYTVKFLNHICRIALWLALILTTLINTNSFGQKFNLGIGGSIMGTRPTFGDVEAKQNFSRKVSAGYSVNLLIGFPLRKQYDLILEAGYSKRGRHLLFNQNTWENNASYKFIDLSMHFRRSFKITLREKIPAQFFFGIGPQINYLFRGSGKIVVGGIDYPYTIAFSDQLTSDYKTMYYRDANRWLFNLRIGGGIKLPLRKNHYLTTEILFISGHTYIGEKDGSYIEILEFQDTLKTNLKSLVFSASYIVEIDLKSRRKGKSTIKKRRL